VITHGLERFLASGLPQETDLILIQEAGRRGAVAASYMWSQRDEFTEVLSNDSVWAQTKES